MPQTAITADPNPLTLPRRRVVSSPLFPPPLHDRMPPLDNIRVYAQRGARSTAESGRRELQSKSRNLQTHTLWRGRGLLQGRLRLQACLVSLPFSFGRALFGALAVFLVGPFLFSLSFRFSPVLSRSLCPPLHGTASRACLLRSMIKLLSSSSSQHGPCRNGPVRLLLRSKIYD